MSKHTAEKMTTLTIGEISIHVDADDAWNGFKASPFDEQVAEVVKAHFWQIHLPWIDITEDARKRFWNEFSKREAAAARTIAVHGIRYANNIDTLNLLKDAIKFMPEWKAGRFKSDEWAYHAAMIGWQFAEIAEKKDHRLLRQLADIIEAGGIDGGTKGGEDSFNGQVIRDFCQLVTTNRTLPTKKRLRESLGLGTDKPEAEKFRIALKSLGLGGLPTAK